MAFLTVNKGVGVAHQIPRNSLALLMVSQVVVILPLAIYISPWIVAVWLFCGYWRAQVYLGRWGYPAGWVKAVLVVGSTIGLGMSGYSTLGLEAATSLLVLAFSLKLVEMSNRRDAYLLIYLSYFLIANAFLFNQSMVLAGYEFLAAIVITAAMVGMNQLQSRVRPLASLRVAAGLILQALPLMLVLFLLFPRIAPLWSIPMPSAATTGIGDHLTPGDIANLALSDAVAFRVAFDGEIPPARELYWRGLVYSNFRFGTWTIAEPLDPLPRADSSESENGLSYEVFLEPTQSKWLFSLDTPTNYGARMDLLADYRLVNPEPILSVTRYRLTSDVDYKMDLELAESLRSRETALPPKDNPRMREYAQALLVRTGSPAAMAGAMLAQIRQAPYSYTLKPPRLSKLDSIDEFWFDTRRGFCTHYAGAMVFAMRAAGIPARLIGGYQGGEINPVSRHLVVRQYQAHSWVEIWLSGQGWTRYDPTGAVAPARVERGLNAALSSEDRATLSFLTGVRQVGRGFVSDMLQWADSLEYRWNLWVVGYDADTQADFLKNWLGKATPTRIGIALLVGGSLSMALVAVAIFWRRRPKQRHRVERLFQSFCVAMAGQGLARSPQETPSSYVKRLAGLARIDAGGLVRRLQAQLYNPELQLSTQEFRTLRQELRKLRFKLAFSTLSNAS